MDELMNLEIHQPQQEVSSPAALQPETGCSCHKGERDCPLSSLSGTLGTLEDLGG